MAYTIKHVFTSTHQLHLITRFSVIKTPIGIKNLQLKNFLKLASKEEYFLTKSVWKMFLLKALLKKKNSCRIFYWRTLS